MHQTNQLNESTSSTMEVISQLQERGFRSDFKFSHGRLICLAAEKAYDSRDLELVGSFRFEGKSDPDDMSILYAFRTYDGTRGQLMDAFGVLGDPGIAEFWMRAVDNRQYSDLVTGIPSRKTIVMSTQ